MTRPVRTAALTLVLALAAAACSSNNNASKSAASSTSAASASSTGGSSSEEMMPLPDYTKSYRTAFTSPASGFKLTDNALKVNVAATGFDLSCALAGKPEVQGKAHYHLLLDKSLINMFCTPDASVSMQNVKPGMHELEVLPALNDHAEVMDGGQTITFDYEPTSPMPVITDITSTAKPSIKITSPKPGETVSGVFDVVVDISNFTPACDLFGKPAVLGYGHWHVNLDSMSGPMMGMGTMLGMSCERVFHATTDGLKSGETHTVIALLTDNGHAPLNIQDEVEVKIG